MQFQGRKKGSFHEESKTAGEADGKESILANVLGVRELQEWRRYIALSRNSQR